MDYSHLDFNEEFPAFDDRTSDASTPAVPEGFEFKRYIPNYDPESVKMAKNQVFIDGAFEDLADELAAYIDNVTKAEEGKGVRAELKPLLEAKQKDEALKKLITASRALNAAPEREFTAAYNLLVYLVIQSPNVNMFLPKVCENLSRPITSSPVNGNGLSLSVLSTLFNLLQEDNAVRYHVFAAILQAVKKSGLFEMLRPELKKLDEWFALWGTDAEDQREMFVQIADVAEDAGEDDQSYQYLLRALRTYKANDAESLSTEEATALTLRTLKSALLSSTHFDFHDLNTLPTIQALSESQPAWSDLLDIFSEKELEDYNDFCDEHDSFLGDNSLDSAVLHRKMRLLTLASLAASTPNKEIPYARISKALQIPESDIEMWVIDVIRAGLVEGKLSQQKQVFLIHRTTYRVFAEKQWREVANRVETWKESLKNVLVVIRREKAAAQEQKDREAHEAERKAQGASGMGAGRRVGGKDMVEMGTD